MVEGEVRLVMEVAGRCLVCSKRLKEILANRVWRIYIEMDGVLGRIVGKENVNKISYTAQP